MHTVHLVDEGSGEGYEGTARSRQVLESVASGAHPETFRIHRTPPIVAFGRHDTLSTGYERAKAEARALGYLPVERLAGGRAAVFHPGTLAFAWAVPASDPRSSVTQRFDTISRVVHRAITSLGFDAHIGELPGEYCPGAFSINLSHRIKVMGVGQRLIAGAAHVGGVIVVDDSDGIRRVLEPVYAALDLPWNPDTAGALSDVKQTDHKEVTAALITALAEEFDLER